MFTSMMLAWILCTFLFFLYKLIAYYIPQTFSKTTPFECGFEPFSKMRRPFSVRYFILVVLFLIFDVETVLLFPCLSHQIVLISANIYLYLFLLILLVGLIYEWKNSMLDWTN